MFSLLSARSDCFWWIIDWYKPWLTLAFTPWNFWWKCVQQLYSKTIKTTWPNTALVYACFMREWLREINDILEPAEWTLFDCVLNFVRDLHCHLVGYRTKRVPPSLPPSSSVPAYPMQHSVESSAHVNPRPLREIPAAAAASEVSSSELNSHHPVLNGNDIFLTSRFSFLW